MRALFLLVVLVLAACDGGPQPYRSPCPGQEAGPVIGGRDYSAGVERCLALDATVRVPRAGDGELGSLIRPSPPLAGATHLLIEYEIAGDPLWYPEKDRPALLSLYLEHRDNSFFVPEGDADAPWQRMWSHSAFALPTTPGRHRVHFPLIASRWHGVFGHELAPPDRFEEMLANTARIGVGLGGPGGKSHGGVSLCDTTLRITALRGVTIGEETQ